MKRIRVKRDHGSAAAAGYPWQVLDPNQDVRVAEPIAYLKEAVLLDVTFKALRLPKEGCDDGYLGFAEGTPGEFPVSVETQPRLVTYRARAGEFYASFRHLDRAKVMRLESSGNAYVQDLE